MKQSCPPAIAAWMLEHFTAGARNDALAGDLEEEFRHRRSPRWYRRQVFSAIAIALFRQARGLFPAAIFAALWSVPLPAVWFYFRRNPDLNRLFDRAAQLDWPYSALATQTLANGTWLLLVWIGMLIYLWLQVRTVRELSLARLCYGLLTTLPVLMAANEALALLYFGRFTTQRVAIIMNPIHDPFVLLTRLPLFLSLLFSIAMALPRPPKSPLCTAR